MLISKKAVAEFLARELDSFDWIKRLRTRTLLEELNSLPVRPQFKGEHEMWRHQLACHFVGVHRPRFLFLLPMGAGKTRIIINLLTQAKRERRLKHGLVVVPRLINMDSWERDIRLYSDLEPHLCSMESIEGKTDALLDPRGDVTLIDYQGLCLALTNKKQSKGKHKLKRDDKLTREAQRVYNFLDFDEIHKLANHQSLWFAIARQLTKQADFVFGNTGTLFGNDPEEAWGQFYLVDQGETFGPNLALFRNAFFKKKTHMWKGEVWTPDRKKDAEFNRLLRNRSLEYAEEEISDLPPCLNHIEEVRMPHEQREHYNRAVSGLIEARGMLSELEAQWLRMRQITSGYLAWKDEYGEHEILFKQNPKLDLLERLADECCVQSKIVVAYNYTRTGQLIMERLKHLGLNPVWLWGGTKDPIAVKQRFLSDDDCRAFVMNFTSGGEGVDGLQTVARYLIVYESPVEPKARRQLLKRIHRPGQKYRSYVYDLVARGTVDRGILDGLAEGHDLYQALVNGSSHKIRRI